LRPLAEFLGSTLKSFVRIKGSEIHVDGVTRRELKVAVRKFLRIKRLHDLRVVMRGGMLHVLPPEKPRKARSVSTTDSGAGISPYSPYRMNPMSSVEFPNYPAVPPRKYKKPKKSR
jgi:hypothetical protein